MVEQQKGEVRLSELSAESCEMMLRFLLTDQCGMCYFFSLFLFQFACERALRNIYGSSYCLRMTDITFTHHSNAQAKVHVCVTTISAMIYFFIIFYE